MMITMTVLRKWSYLCPDFSTDDLFHTVLSQDCDSFKECGEKQNKKKHFLKKSCILAALMLPDGSCNGATSESTNYSPISRFSAVHQGLGHSGIQMSSQGPGAKGLTPFILFLLTYSLKVTMIYEGFNVDRWLDGMFFYLAPHDLIPYAHHCCIPSTCESPALFWRLWARL